MKILLILLVALMFIMTACKSDVELAEQYNLDLKYYGNALKFEKLNMSEEAFTSCNRTSILKSECFISLAQFSTVKKTQIRKEVCDGIIPNEKMGMTKDAFRLVYVNSYETLEPELKEKLRPSRERVKVNKQIKEECYNHVR